MALVGRRRTIGEGDTVFLYFTYDLTTPVVVGQDVTVNNVYGHFRISHLLGRPFGCKLMSVGKNKRGFCFALHPTPELWTLALPHRTQILYVADISNAIERLGIRSGSVVAECGTGSGSMSVSIARSVAPRGFLHTFDFNAERVRLATEEFERHGISHLVRVRHRNVCERGFPQIGGGVDAVFLDVPNPWAVVENARGILRPHGRICSFSPCIEQVQRTCTALRELCFSDIVVIEVLLRYYDVRHNQKYERADVGEVDPTGLDEIETEFEREKAELAAKAEALTADEQKALEDELAEGERRAAAEAAAAAAAAAVGEKRARSGPGKSSAAKRKRGPNTSPEQLRVIRRRAAVQKAPKQWTEPALAMRALGSSDLGHSGYLTFATRRPDSMLGAVRAHAAALEAAEDTKRAERLAKRAAAADAAEAAASGAGPAEKQEA